MELQSLQIKIEDQIHDYYVRSPVNGFWISPENDPDNFSVIVELDGIYQVYTIYQDENIEILHREHFRNINYYGYVKITQGRNSDIYVIRSYVNGYWVSSEDNLEGFTALIEIDNKLHIFVPYLPNKIKVTLLD